MTNEMVRWREASDDLLTSFVKLDLNEPFETFLPSIRWHDLSGPSLLACSVFYF